MFFLFFLFFLCLCPEAWSEEFVIAMRKLRTKEWVEMYQCDSTCPFGYRRATPRKPLTTYSIATVKKTKKALWEAPCRVGGCE